MRALVLALVVVAVAAAAARSQDAGTVIVPGQQIGGWSLDTSVQDYLAAYGDPGPQPEPAADAADGSGRLSLYVWSPHAISASADEGGRPRAVVLLHDGSAFKTARGVGIGSSSDVVLRAFGTPSAVTTPAPGANRLIYDGLGLALTMRTWTLKPLVGFLGALGVPMLYQHTDTQSQTVTSGDQFHSTSTTTSTSVSVGVNLRDLAKVGGMVVAEVYVFRPGTAATIWRMQR